MSSNPIIEYERLISNIPVGVYQFRTTPPDERMSFDYVNQKYCEMLQISAAEIYQDASVAFRVIHPDDYENFFQINGQSMRTSQPFSWEGRMIVTGATKWIRIVSIPDILENGEVFWYGFQVDITAQKNIESEYCEAQAMLKKRVKEIETLQVQLREQAMRDYLTGLFNRRYLDATLERELIGSKRENRTLSIVMIDIDYLKSINDNYGHQAGDQVIIGLGKLLGKDSRASDIACRYGGDEFVVVMLDASSTDAYKRANHWRAIFAQTKFQANNQDFSTTLSIGIATYPTHASSPRGIFEAADEALYHSKKYHNLVTTSRRTSTGSLSLNDYGT